MRVPVRLAAALVVVAVVAGCKGGAANTPTTPITSTAPSTSTEPSVAPSATPAPTPRMGSFAVTGSMKTAREDATATLLADGLNNLVLVAGGDTSNGKAAGTSLATAEIYDPAAGTFKATGSMKGARSDQTASLFARGKVLIAGGQK